MSLKLLLVTIAWLVCSCFGSGQLRFINTYGDYMVLQHGNGGQQHSTINGISTYGSSDKITLKLSTMAAPNTILQSKTVNVNNNSLWQIILDPVDASNTEYYIEATSAVNSSDKITLSNLLFGDVYICSGQSNMQFTVDQAFNATQSVIEANNYPNIRLFTVQDNQSNTEITELIQIEEPWSIASNTTVSGGNWTYFSAVCWFFGKDLYDELQIPMGLIATDWGGTPIRVWMSKDAISNCPNETNVALIDNIDSPSSDSVLWNSMIYPFLSMTIKGAIWYQGETDAMNEKYAESYECGFKSMINDWRVKWNKYSETNDIFPFGFVQLSVWNDNKNQTCGDIWSQCIGAAQVRWAQTGNMGYVPNKKLANVFMAVSIDLGDPTTPFGPGAIHPRYKQQMAQRLSNAAFNIVYGKSDIYWLGPYGDNVTCTVDSDSKKATISVNFGNVNDDGLLMKNPTGFEWFNSTSKIWIYIDEDIFSVTNNGMSIEFVLNGSDISSLRYAFYLAPCMPMVGIYNCAIYDKKGLLPAGGFILSVNC